jgi:hypothetical protein
VEAEEVYQTTWEFNTTRNATFLFKQGVAPIRAVALPN